MTIYQLATMAGQQIKALDYEDRLHDDIMGCKSAADIVNLWLDYLIENRDSKGFQIHVDSAGLLVDLITWASEARDVLTCGNPG